MSGKIEGVPEGWELVRIGSAYSGESALGPQGDIIFCSVPCWASKNYVIVRKIEPPKPVYVPWTYETCPVGAVVMRKQENFRGQIGAVGESGAYIARMFYSFSKLLEDFEIDGTPCGTIEVQE